MQLPDPLIEFIVTILGLFAIGIFVYALVACAEFDLRNRGWADYETGPIVTDPPPIRHPPPLPRLPVPCSLPPAVPQPQPQPQFSPVKDDPSNQNQNQMLHPPTAIPHTQLHFSPVEDELPNQNQLDKNKLPENYPPNQMVCSICQTNGKDLAFGCGHMSCRDCGSKLSNCHICRQRITARVMLFSD